MKSYIFVTEFQDHNITVKLPKDYYRSKKKYPAIILQDGDYLFKKLNAQVIFIGVDPINRDDEYTPWQEVIVDTDCQGEANQYLKLLRELLEDMRQKFRISEDVKDIGIGGGSYGGLVSFYALFKAPDLFGKFILLSPSVWYPNFYEFVLSQDFPSNKVVYWYVGQSEGIDHPYIMKNMVPTSNQLMPIVKEKLENSGSKFKFDTETIGEHHHRFFKKYFKKALKYFNWS